MNLDLRSVGSAKVLNIIIAILVVVALVLGYFVYSKLYPGGIPVLTETEESSQEGVVPITGEPVRALSPQEQAALTPPGEGASEEDFRAHFATVQEVAVNESVLTIGENCAVYPAIMRTKLGTELTFVNTDTVQHSITFNENHSYLVMPGEQIKVSASFGQGAGLYGYGCDLGTTAAGMMLVAE